MQINSSTLKRRMRVLVWLVVCAMGFAPTAQACTGITLTAVDGNVVRARTMEFNVNLESSVIVIPRAQARTGTTPDGKPGLSWKAKYASVGVSPMGMPHLVDGLNEKGLSMGLFYFNQSAQFQPYNPANASRTLASWELGSYILDNFATVDEVRQGLADVTVAPVIFNKFKIVLPVHFVVTDTSGKSIVIEYVAGKLNIHDNNIGVITNNPPFDWHMTNLQNYVNLSLQNSPAQRLGGVEIEGLGQGTGLLGMPGDFTSPSRFVRAAIFAHGVAQSPDANHAIFQAFHILNNFDIPKGVARDGEKDKDGNINADYTQWTSANDLTARRFYFRTYEDSTIRVVDLNKQDLDANRILSWPMNHKESAVDLGTPN
ncbi:choloylglycine hydrolase family protein [Alcaligenaceae bacterium CGII-47]|nr:choloylglycine hydrolase family protein [Alcaligenaceae bacterium CGII-47]